MDYSGKVPEGSFEARELLHAVHRRTGLLGYLGGVATTIITIVLAAMIIQKIEDPGEAKRKAAAFEANVQEFSRNADGDRRLFNDAAGYQRDTLLISVEAMMSGDTTDRIRHLVEGESATDGLNGRFETYRYATDEIDLLLRDSKRRLDPQVNTLTNYLGNLRRIAQKNIECVRKLGEHYKSAGPQPYRGVRCVTDAAHYYVLQEQLTLAADCEERISAFLHDSSEHMRAEAALQSAVADGEASSSQGAQTPPDTYWSDEGGGLRRACGNALNAHVRLLDYIAATTYYPFDGNIERPMPPTILAAASSSHADSNPFGVFLWGAFPGLLLWDLATNIK